MPTHPPVHQKDFHRDEWSKLTRGCGYRGASLKQEWLRPLWLPSPVARWLRPQRLPSPLPEFICNELNASSRAMNVKKQHVQRPHWDVHKGTSCRCCCNCLCSTLITYMMRNCSGQKNVECLPTRPCIKKICIVTSGAS